MHYRDLTPPSETVRAFYAELNSLIPREKLRFEGEVPLSRLINLRGPSPLTPGEAQGVVVTQTGNITGTRWSQDYTRWGPHLRRLTPEATLVSTCALELLSMPRASRSVHSLSKLQRLAARFEPGADPDFALARVADGGKHLAAISNEHLLQQAAKEVERDPQRAAQLCLWWALSEELSAPLPSREALAWSARRRAATAIPEFIGHGHVQSMLATLRGHIPEWPELMEISRSTDASITRYHTPKVISELRTDRSVMRHFQQGGRHVLWLCSLNPDFDPVPRRNEPRAPMPPGAVLWRAFTWHNRAQQASQLRPLRPALNPPQAPA